MNRRSFLRLFGAAAVTPKSYFFTPKGGWVQNDAGLYTNQTSLLDKSMIESFSREHYLNTIFYIGLVHPSYLYWSRSDTTYTDLHLSK